MSQQADTQDAAAETTLDEGQARMMAAAQRLFHRPDIYAKLHEFDDACQPERMRK